MKGRRPTRRELEEEADRLRAKIAEKKEQCKKQADRHRKESARLEEKIKDLEDEIERRYRILSFYDPDTPTPAELIKEAKRPKKA